MTRPYNVTNRSNLWSKLYLVRKLTKITPFRHWVDNNIEYLRRVEFVDIKVATLPTIFPSMLFPAKVSFRIDLLNVIASMTRQKQSRERSESDKSISDKKFDISIVFETASHIGLERWQPSNWRTPFSRDDLGQQGWQVDEQNQCR